MGRLRPLGTLPYPQVVYMLLSNTSLSQATTTEPLSAPFIIIVESSLKQYKGSRSSIYITHSLQWTVNMENMNMNMEVSNRSVFPTSFDRGRFEGNLFSFENGSDLQIIYLTLLISKTSFYRCFLRDCSRMVKYELYILLTLLILVWRLFSF